jgi:superoxide dismutase
VLLFFSCCLQPTGRAFAGGGFVNHVLFWNCMAKNGTEIDPKGALMNAIDKVHAMRQILKVNFNLT